MLKKIIPNGNYKKFLETQISGLTGHIENAGFPFDRVSWKTCDYMSNNENPGWWIYEQTAYWLDGYTRLGILLDDKKIINEASEIIYGAISRADEDGFIGPKFLKPMVEDWYGRWAYVVFFRACMALYEYNSDKNILDAMIKHYKNDKAPYTQHG